MKTFYCRLNATGQVEFSEWANFMIVAPNTASPFQFAMVMGVVPQVGKTYQLTVTIIETSLERTDMKDLKDMTKEECCEVLCLQVEAHRAVAHQSVVATAMQQPDVLGAIRQAQVAGVPWAQIFGVLINFAISVLSGAPIDWAALVAQIIALIPLAGRTP